MKKQQFYNHVIDTTSTSTPSGYKPAGSLNLEEAFSIYQAGYIARLTEALQETFESVWNVLGDDIFSDVCQKFITAHPSQHYNLSEYSVKFIDFLISQSASVEFPFLSELAHLGWLHKEIFHRPQEAGLSGETLMAYLEDDDQRVQLVAGVELISSEFCLFDIWKALKDQKPPPESFQGRQFLILYKADQQVYVKLLTEGQYRAYENISVGMPLMTALDHLAEFELTEFFYFVAKHALLKSASA